MLCGESSYDSAGLARNVLGPGFVDFWAFVDGRALEVCRGCQRLLAGKPGDTPTPLRMRSLLAHGGAIHELNRGELWSVMSTPPDGEWVLSWATGGKIHHWLRADVSHAERMLIGSDRSTIEYVPARDWPLKDAVAQMVGHFTREAIATGAYHPKSVQAFGPAAWSQLEAIVEPNRPSALLDLLVTIAPAPEALTKPEEPTDMIDAYIDQAAELMADVAHASRYRREHGKEFWGGVFRHRLERFKRSPLEKCLARLLDALNCEPYAPGVQAALEKARAYDSTTGSEVERALRDATALVVALAYTKIQERREA